MNTRNLEVPISVVSVVVGVNLKIDDLISLTTDVLDVFRAVLYSLLKDR